MKKAFSIFTILSIIMSFSPVGVYAQSASDSANINPASDSASFKSDPTLISNSVQKAVEKMQGVTSFINSISNGQVLISPETSISADLFSANLKQSQKVRLLNKKNYRAGESVDISVENVPKDEVSVTVIDPFGKAVSNVIIEKTQEQALTQVLIHTPSEFRPGKYTIEVSDLTGVISTQEFTWGVLAINVNKSIYLQNENADIAMAVLDETGEMVCNASVDLKITAPYGQVTDLSTSNGAIIINPTCRVHAVTNMPDYEAHFQTTDVGSYAMELTATTASGAYSITDGFQVRDSVPFDIERLSATRIYPPENYPVTIKIHANEDFTGKIIESVPSSFQISNATQSGVVSFTQESSIPDALGASQNYGIPHLGLPFNGNYPVTLGFGEQIDDSTEAERYKQYGLDGHDGIDFGLPEGTPVVAVDAGTVVLAQKDWIYGTSIVIQHAWGRSYYGHLSKFEVTKGEQVSMGTEIGLSGSTGLVTGPHLHFGLKPNGADLNNLYFGKIDPAPFLGISTNDPALYATDFTPLSKAIIWNVEVGKGADFTIGYNYKAPDKSPYLYTVGPLQFVGTTSTPSGTARFDVSAADISTSSAQTENPFVLGVSTESAQFNASDSSSLNTKNATPSAIPTLPQIPQTIVQPVSNQPQLIFKEIRLWQIAADATSYITTGTSWTIPGDWNNSNYSIEVIGGGGGGLNGGANQGNAGGGGGGGAYSKISNVTGLFTPGKTVTVAVGSAGSTNGGTGGDTYVCNSTANCTLITGSAVQVGAKGGAGGTALTGGTGGQATSGFPTSGGTRYNGGNGGGSVAAGGVTGRGGGGGGGAAGLNGAGIVGGTTSFTQIGSTGGNGDNNLGGTGGISNTNGNPGAEWDSTHGSGGGGGGGNGGGSKSNGINAGNAGSYGAGGGGGGEGGKSSSAGGIGGSGYQGLIIITYTPATPTLAQLMRHGAWFNDGLKRPFTF